MEDAKLTIRLPKTEINFIKEYAKKHKLTVSEFVQRYIRRLQNYREYPTHPEIEKISGIIPKNIDAKKIYYEHIVKKHQ